MSYQCYWGHSRTSYQAGMLRYHYPDGGQVIGESKFNFHSNLYTMLTFTRLTMGRWASLSAESPFHSLRATIIWVDGNDSKFYHHLTISKVNDFHKTVDKSSCFKIIPKFSSNVQASNLNKARRNPCWLGSVPTLKGEATLVPISPVEVEFPCYELLNHLKICP